MVVARAWFQRFGLLAVLGGTGERNTDAGSRGEARRPLLRVAEVSA
jgi:hypothetical protein